MPGALLYGAVAALGLGIVLLVVTVVPGRPRAGVAAALEVIDRRYGQAPQATPDPGPSALPGWLTQLARRLSPGGMTVVASRSSMIAGPAMRAPGVRA